MSGTDHPPRVLFVYNPDSGRGRACAALKPVRDALLERGIELLEHHLRSGVPDVETVKGFRTIIAAGGDGTVAAMCGVASASGVPLLHFPAGTENLFSREFMMPRDPAHVARWVEAGRTRAVDLAWYRINRSQERPVVIMLSLGPDAGVIHRLHKIRRGAITHLSYIPRVLEELADPTLPQVTIEVDGRVVAEGVRGMTLIANLRKYGGGFNPAPHADASDGELDVVFMPSGGSIRWLFNMGLSFVGASALVPGRVAVRGRRVRVMTSGGSMQSDGEAAWADASHADIDIEVRPRALSILVDPQGR